MVDICTVKSYSYPCDKNNFHGIIFVSRISGRYMGLNLVNIMVDRWPVLRFCYHIWSIKGLYCGTLLRGDNHEGFLNNSAFKIMSGQLDESIRSVPQCQTAHQNQTYDLTGDLEVPCYFWTTNVEVVKMVRKARMADILCMRSPAFEVGLQKVGWVLNLPDLFAREYVVSKSVQESKYQHFPIPCQNVTCRLRLISTRLRLFL